MITGPVLALWATRALAVCPGATTAAIESLGDRLARHDQVALRVTWDGRRLRDPELMVAVDHEWCLPDTLVTVEVPDLEGLRRYARALGLDPLRGLAVPCGALIGVTEAPIS